MEDAVPVAGFGGQRWLLVRATPVYDRQGTLAGTTVILQDVTRLRRFDEMRNDLVATVAHEFRTPLTSLRMAIHLCLEGTAGPITDKQADLLEAGREDCQRLQTIVDDLLDLARLQAGKTAIQRSKVPARTLLEDALRSMRSAAQDKGLNLEQAGFPVAENVSADAERISLVFSNLITNAIRHTPPEGSIRLSARVVGEAVRFEVTDTGEGIPLEYQPRLFHRFYRVPGAASGAAGLGLALCKEIVEGHGGAIGVISQPGKGSTFWFTLPIATDEGRP
jgi:signal transduction histidine kinase